MAKKTAKMKSKRTVRAVANKIGKVEGATKDKISFDYIKSNQFRVIHVDGVHGGATPKGHAIQMAFFSERAPIPKRETYGLVGGKLGERKEKVERDAIVREVEVEVIMDLETAKAITKWLGEKIESA